MPVILKKMISISGNYTQEELDVLKDYINTFRVRMADDDSEKNILNKKAQQYSDDKIVRLIFSALKDINGGAPKTNYGIVMFHNSIDSDLILKGAIIFALMAEGILQLRNQIDFNDSGLSIAMFNKTGAYQGWAGFLLQEYMLEKRNFKSGVIVRSPNAGFLGIGSEFGYDGW